MREICADCGRRTDEPLGDFVIADHGTESASVERRHVRCSQGLRRVVIVNRD